MDTMTETTLSALLRPSAGPCLSLYLPMVRAGRETQQAPLRLTRLLRQARTELRASGQSERTIGDLLAPIEGLLDDYQRWQHPVDGHAIFRSMSLFGTVRVPFLVPERLMIQSQFYLVPLLPLLTEQRPYYVLAIGRHEVRLLHCTRHEVSTIALPDSVPQSLEQLTRYNDPQRYAGFHTDTPRTGTGRRSAVFYGHGGASDFDDDALAHYCRAIDHGLAPVLSSAPAPLVLAGVQELLAIYRSETTYPAIQETAILGNADDDQRSITDLHTASLSIMEREWARISQQRLADIRAAVATGHGSDEPMELRPAAEQGRISLLAIADGAQRWGITDPITGGLRLIAEATPAADELLNQLVVTTLRHGGDIEVVPGTGMPTESPVAAIYRY